jgi:uncharacterized membrane protein YkvA (DUF1232 family)
MKKSSAVALVGCVSLVYLMNPSAGIIEIIPDNLPVVGNLDEATATALLLSSLRYFGLDLANLFKKEDKKDVLKKS